MSISPEFSSWRLKTQRYNLVGESCPHCATKIFPPRDICPDCGAEAKEPHKFSGKGEIYSFAPVKDAPEGFEDQTPYTIALVRLEEGPLVTAQLTDLDPNQPINIGMKVEQVTRIIKPNKPRGNIVYGYKFRPILSPVNQRVYPSRPEDNNSGGI